MIILTILISGFIFFTVAISKVQALEERPIKDGSAQIYGDSNLKSENNCTNENYCGTSYTGGMSQVAAIHSLNTNMSANRYYGLYAVAEIFLYSFPYKYNTMEPNDIIIQTKATNGTLTDVTNYCNVTRNDYTFTSEWQIGTVNMKATRNVFHIYCSTVKINTNSIGWVIRLRNSPVTPYISASSGWTEARLQIIPDTDQAIENQTNTIVNEIASQIRRIINKNEELWRLFQETNNWTTEQWTTIHNQYESVNKTNYNDLNSAENGLYNQYGVNGSEIDHLLPDINVNGNASQFLWYIVQSIMNNKILTMFMAILFLGVIATLLNR